MRRLRSITVLLLLSYGQTLVQACNKHQTNSQEAMQIESVEQAKQLIKECNTGPEKFVLPIPTSHPLTVQGQEVSADIAMAIITDEILAKGWMPDGFEEKNGMRYYKYSRFH